jgi:hypothetical protein
MAKDALELLAPGQSRLDYWTCGHCRSRHTYVLTRQQNCFAYRYASEHMAFRQMGFAYRYHCAVPGLRNPDSPARGPLECR